MIASLEVIGKRAYSTMHTLRNTYDICRSAIERSVQGDFVECGVAAGAQVAAMAKALEPYFNEYKNYGSAYVGPRVHLFDCFEGIPQAGPEDVEFLAAGHKPGLTKHSMEEVQRNMREWGVPDELLVYHPGYFDQTLPFFNEKIAVLRLDGDLYESTRVAIAQLYPQVSIGGHVIVDDWDLSGARKAVLEYVGNGFGPISWIKQQ